MSNEQSIRSAIDHRFNATQYMSDGADPLRAILILWTPPINRPGTYTHTRSNRVHAGPWGRITWMGHRTPLLDSVGHIRTWPDSRPSRSCLHSAISLSTRRRRPIIMVQFRGDSMAEGGIPICKAVDFCLAAGRSCGVGLRDGAGVASLSHVAFAFEC